MLSSFYKTSFVDFIQGMCRRLALGTVLSFFHEIGHAWVYEQRGVVSKVRTVQSAIRQKLQTPTAHDLDVVLNEERQAWAFALKLLRPFIQAQCHPHLTIENVRTFIHEYALKTYNLNVAVHLRDLLPEADQAAVDTLLLSLQQEQDFYSHH